MHAADWQLSEPLHWSPSEQVAPSGFAGFVHSPVDESQVPASWHASLAMQVTGVPGLHVPAWQVSAPLQALPSPQEDPLGLAGFVHCPVEASHVPGLWHSSLATHVTGVPGVQAPAWQTSAPLHASLSAQEEPLGLAGFEHWPVAESQVPASWHWSLAVQVTAVPGLQLPA
jgi:hypothetical protein